MLEMENFILLIFSKTTCSHSLGESYTDSNKAIKNILYRKTYNARHVEESSLCIGDLVVMLSNR